MFKYILKIKKYIFLDFSCDTKERRFEIYIQYKYIQLMTN